jgi:hypothetical protein
VLVGRFVERTRLDRLIADAKAGQSRSLVLRGEAGIGKTALLNYAAAIAGGARVLRVVGIESEAEIPFAGVQLIFARFADRLDALPGPQGHALRAAFGASSASGERLLVGAGILTLLSELAEDGPLLCLIDDVQWFDQSSIDALLSALRRLHTDPVATIFAARDGDRPFPAAGIDSVTLRRLDRADCIRLLATVRTLPNEIAERVLVESGGNPLAILELAANDGAASLTAPVAPLPAAGRLEERIRALPERTRFALPPAPWFARRRVRMPPLDSCDVPQECGECDAAEMDRVTSPLLHYGLASSDRVAELVARHVEPREWVARGSTHVFGRAVQLLVPDLGARVNVVRPHHEDVDVAVYSPVSSGGGPEDRSVPRLEAPRCDLPAQMIDHRVPQVHQGLERGSCEVIAVDAAEPGAPTILGVDDAVSRQRFDNLGRARMTDPRQTAELPDSEVVICAGKYPDDGGCARWQRHAGWLRHAHVDDCLLLLDTCQVTRDST